MTPLSPSRAWLPAALSLVLTIPALGQGQFAGHQRHVDSGNLHLWWDGIPSTAFGNGGLAAIRDLNADGHPDLIMGSPGNTTSIKGKVHILSGREGTEILATLTEAKAGGNLGFSIAVIGDVNGDKIDDFVVSSPNATVGKLVQAGLVQLYSGKIVSNKLTLLHTFSGALAKGQFGYSVAGPGYMDGDGIPDIAIGEPGDVTTTAGAVHVYSGDPKHKQGAYARIFVQKGIQTGERYGVAVAAAGDVNSDKRPDLIVGAELWDGPGGKDHGRAEALAWTGTTSPRVFQLAAGRGVATGDRYGHSVAKAGVMAGSARVIVGAPWDDTKAKDAGKATVLSPGKPWVPAITVTGDSASDYFGWAVAPCSDVDLDGTPDFAVSAPFDDPVAGVRDSGSVYVYAWSPKTKKVKEIAKRFHEGSTRGSGMRYGWSLVNAGDVDQDDFDDLLAGSDWWYVLAGSRQAERRIYLDTPVAQTLYADRGHAIISKGAAQVNYSIQAGKTFAGQLMVFLGSGPHNLARPAPCLLKIGNLCMPIQWGSPWFQLSLSNALNPVVVLLDSKGNGSLTMSLPPYTGTPLPLKVYSAGLMFKLPPAPFAPTGATNAIPLWVR